MFRLSFLLAFVFLATALAAQKEPPVQIDPLHPSRNPTPSSSVSIQPLEEKDAELSKELKPAGENQKALFLLKGDLQAQMEFYQKPEAPKLPPLPHPNNWAQCQFDTEQSTLKRRQLIWRPFFSYTPEKYTEYFKQTAFLNAEGALAKEEDKMYLHLKIRIGTPLGAKAYGALAANSALYIKQLNGTNILLRTPDGASAQSDDEETIYQVRYLLERSDLRALKESEIDLVRINWSVGYEAYDVYYVDFLWDQFHCFD